MTTSETVEFDSAVSALSRARSVTILCHVQPDADTIGSGLALALVLHRRGTTVCVSFAEPAELPASLRSLPGVEHLVAPAEVPRETDLLVVVDCGSVTRLGALADRMEGAATSLVLDHHRSNTRFGTINLVDPDAVSTTSVVAALLDAWQVPIDAEIAHCLYAGLVTDSGSFRWVRAGTHALAEQLLATGIDGAEITRTLLDTHPFGWLRMLSQVLASARIEPEAHGGVGLVYAYVLREDIDGLRAEDAESVVDIVRTADAAGIAAVFKEGRVAADANAAAPDSPPQRRWTVSLRSRDSGPGAEDGVDVSLVATALGGGGHRYAAGYTTYGEPEELIAQLRAALG
ncbi:DHH family phosphoesterase [Nocardia donostiensis]|uniref:Phosphoesterase n=1 Tax=Nocardia donostiensis TaxID=1538463 RepID=A0A1W0AU38_9NOCA|nr:bifunctional oligoribonuclease/PAP phosphatase NrnA [Nocardia donostiensis]ONM47825.1 phosphoesterase [Nocardia donostiensis]OQS13755.1 phosphoesterase [Nocardia donostiensis]OQS22577.1 phosphoesterase [Nocardia donostiensis]